MKICSKCSVVKNESEFTKDKYRITGLCPSCRECDKIIRKNSKNNNYDYRRQQAEKFLAKFPKRYKLQRIKARAKNRGLTFNLKEEDITLPSHCPVLGIPLFFGNRQNPNSPSIDRIDNTRGYEKDNIIVVSQRANALKSDASIDELEKIVSFYKNLQCPKMSP